MCQLSRTALRMRSNMPLVVSTIQFQGVSTAALLAALLALAPTIALVLAVLMLARRRLEIKRFERSHLARADAIEKGSHKARLLHPDIDLSKCIGCGSCVRACPEDGVLDLMYGQAVVLHGARCVGHGRCAEACPTGAIALTFGDLSDRTDLPAISEEYEAVGVPGLFIAGELSGFSLIRTAVSHGTTVANVVARRLAESVNPAPAGVHDLLIVGIGPAGLACALRAKELGINILVIEQADQLGGTVSAYPRKKLVMTQPIQLPLHGTLSRFEYLKEDLVSLWQSLITKHRLPIRTGVRLIDVARQPDGTLTLQTSAGPIVARNVCLCLGRRGTPRKLGVPGENLPKVAYSLIDAASFTGRRILVVGGGDSAAEAAVGLAEEGRNTVVLCSRAKDWVRVKAKNEARIRKAVEEQRLSLLMESNTSRIDPETVTIVRQPTGGPAEELTLPNDDVIILAGGDPPFELLTRAGVSFDPSKRARPTAVVDSTTPLLWAAALLLGVAVLMVTWAMLHNDYYGATFAERTQLENHGFLRPAGRFGLAMGLLAVALFFWNILYLARRSHSIGRLFPGSLRSWMGSARLHGPGELSLCHRARGVCLPHDRGRVRVCRARCRPGRGPDRAVLLRDRAARRQRARDQPRRTARTIGHAHDHVGHLGASARADDPRPRGFARQAGSMASVARGAHRGDGRRPLSNPADAP